MKLLAILSLSGLAITSTLGQSCSKDKSCATPSCCSQWGFCGFGPDFCGSSCVRDCNLRPECGQYSLTPDCPLKVCCSQYGFCGTTADFCNAQCQSNCNAPIRKTCSADSATVKVGYYASWSRDRTCKPFFADQINPRIYTHLNYAFGQISGGVMIPPTGTDLSEIQAFNGLKSVNTGLKTLISVGGWAFNDPGPTQQEFHNIILTSASRARFISSVQTYLASYGFDGIDIDYEYPSAPDRGGSPEDKQNFVHLVSEMRAVFGSKYLITIAAPASYWYLQHFAIGEMSKYLDFINVMTYDIHGTWDADIASLGPVVRSHTNIKEVQSALDLFLRDGVASNKLVLGLAYYGRSFTLANPACNDIDCPFSGPAKSGPCTNSPGTLAWFEINDIIADTGAEPIYDSNSMSKILTFDTDQWVAYDDDETLLLRQQFAGESCLLGTMIWSIDQGIIQTSGTSSLQRSGKLNINFVDLYVWSEIVLGTILTLRHRISASYRYAGDEVGATSVRVHRSSSTCSSLSATSTFTTTTTSTCSATPTPLPANPPNDNNDADFFWDTIFQVLNSDPEVFNDYRNIADTPIMNLNRNDPFQVRLRRRINNGVNDCYRLEYLEAIVYPHHLQPVRNSSYNFNGSDRKYMFDCLEARSDQDPTGMIRDEAGHGLAAVLNGFAVRENLWPQHPYVNARRASGGQTGSLPGWADNDDEMRRYLRSEGLNGYQRSYVRFRAVGHYVDSQSGRPEYFSFRSEMYREGSLEPVMVSENYYLCNGSPASQACPRPDWLPHGDGQ